MTALQAIRKTRKILEEEHLAGKEHEWNVNTCPLCKHDKEGKGSCYSCILTIVFGVGCIRLLERFYSSSLPSTQDMNDFLYALEEYVKEGI